VALVEAWRATAALAPAAAPADIRKCRSRKKIDSVGKKKCVPLLCVYILLVFARHTFCRHLMETHTVGVSN
jgi:hypothetical protein